MTEKRQTSQGYIIRILQPISQRNLWILLILWCSFKLWWNFCLDQNFVYNANGPFGHFLTLIPSPLINFRMANWWNLSGCQSTSNMLIRCKICYAFSQFHNKVFNLNLTIFKLIWLGRTLPRTSKIFLVRSNKCI
jgi:hypothetical protein